MDYVVPGRLYKLEVSKGKAEAAEKDGAAKDATWNLDGGSPCSPDGAPDLDRTTPDKAAASNIPLSNVRIGAVIGRIGGSTADGKPDDRMLLFAVGRHCVIQAPDGKIGALYLGVNDVPASAAKLSGSFEVEISEAV